MVISILHHRHTRHLVTQLLLLSLPSTKNMVISKNLRQHPATGQCLLLRSVCVTSQKQQFAARTRTKDFIIKACDSGRFYFLTQKHREKDKSLFSSLQKIGLLSGAIVTKTDRAEWKTDSLQSSPVVFCLHLAPLWPTLQSSLH